MSVSIAPLRPLETNRFLPLAPPALHGLLWHASAAGPILAIGATAGAQAVGLALARISPGAPTLLSLEVVPTARGAGVGRRLLSAVEAAAAAAGAARLEVVHRTNTPEEQAIEGLFRRNGWSAPVARMQFLVLGSAILAAPWMCRGERPGSPVRQLEERDRASVYAIARVSGFPGELDPSSTLHARDRELSFVLELDGAVVGWLVTHRLDSRTLRYSSLFVPPERSGGGMLLLRRAIRGQLSPPDVIPHGLFGTSLNFPAMIAFTRRHLEPWAEASFESVGRHKVLDQTAQSVRLRV